MTCEALVLGSVAGLALTAAVLSFQVITDRKADARNTPKLKEKGRLTAILSQHKSQLFFPITLFVNRLSV